jgi:AcrR family transcriptional regulator
MAGVTSPMTSSRRSPAPSSTLYDVPRRSPGSSDDWRHNHHAERVAERVADRVAEHVADRMAGKAESLAAKAESKADRLASKAERKAEQIRLSAEQHAATLDRLANHLEALDLWTRAEPGSRRPRLTRDDIAVAAVGIADAEGLSAVSMRRLATDLGVGTMSLYHYVNTKDELMTLINDHVLGELVIPDSEGLPEDWREAMVVIANRSRAALERHPWIFDITDDPPFGPNAVRHFDQSLHAVSGLDAPLRARLDILMAVDEYVFGFCLHARNNAGGGPQDEVRDYIASLLKTGDYPATAAEVESLGLDATWAEVQAAFADESRFERNVRRLLNGIAADYQR